MKFHIPGNQALFGVLVTASTRPTAETPNLFLNEDEPRFFNPLEASGIQGHSVFGVGRLKP
jgi:hypothetical protein